MSTTEQLTITLPSSLAELVRARVASGKYGSESDFVCESVAMHEFNQASEAEGARGPSDDWLRQYALPALKELETSPSTGTPLEDVEAELLRRRTLRRKQAA